MFWGEVSTRTPQLGICKVGVQPGISHRADGELTTSLGPSLLLGGELGWMVGTSSSSQPCLERMWQLSGIRAPKMLAVVPAPFWGGRCTVTRMALVSCARA